MKYLAFNAQTETAIRMWASGKKLILAKHFFWRAGRENQRSQYGLLRSLLYQILAQWPECIPAICPETWEASDRLAITDVMKGDTDRPWDLKHLMQAFTLMQQQDTDNIRICVFVDGLDEYDGDHSDLVEILDGISATTFMKIIGSSRPWNAFADCFGSNKDQQLVLQDLTYGDIALYVKSTLQQDDRFYQLDSTVVHHKELIKVTFPNETNRCDLRQCIIPE